MARPVGLAPPLPTFVAPTLDTPTSSVPTLSVPTLSVPTLSVPPLSVPKWHSAYRIGIDRIDEQHQGLFALHADFVHAVERGGSMHLIDTVAAELHRYAAFHFADEEAVMARMGYDRLADHHALHGGLHRMIDKLALLPRERTSLLVVAEFISVWIRQHILVEDRDVARFLMSRAA